MSVHKVIKFYVCEPQPSMLMLSQNIKTNIEILKTVFPYCGAYTFMYEKERYAIDIIEIGKTFIFGTCAKENELKYTNFYQTRNTDTNITTPYTSIESGQQLEVYTYFYIECTKNRMVAIQHKNIAKIHCILSSFICEKSQNMVNYYIAPERFSDIKLAAKMLKRSKAIELSFAKGKGKDNIEPLSRALGDLKYDSYTVTFKTTQNDDTIINKLYDLSVSERENMNTIKLVGKNEFGLDETINFIETQYTKNIPFELTEDFATNTDYIKNKLSQCLTQYF